MAHKRDDLLWKGLLEDLFVDFLRFFVTDADKLFDFSREPLFLDKELEQLFPPEGDEFSPKVVDKLAQVYTREGKEEWILCHVEIQGQYRKDFSRRMYSYYSRILDKYDRSIASFAIFTEASTRMRSNIYEREYLGTKLLYKFNTYKVATQSREDLLGSNNPFALVVAVAQTAFTGRRIKDSRKRDELLLHLKRPLARELLSKDIAKEKIRVLMNFLRYYVRFDNEEFSAIFEEDVEELTERTNAMGIEQLLLEMAEKRGALKERAKVERLLAKAEAKAEAKAKAKAEAKAEAEKKAAALKMKNSGFSIEMITDILGLSSDEIEKL
ncbi:hypothetical protein [Arcticibacter sp. MXS-1]|uniref:hypothetical protein n=1 Tax=Arcticibacter sp. MXS-1 TaxID=3341726 RepID=UPI0035A820E1